LVENVEPLLFADRRRIVKAWDRTEPNSRPSRTCFPKLTASLPENRTGACRELLGTALALTDDLIKHSTTPAALMGSKGGSVTAKRHGSEHYRQMAARRKTHGGGRPRKESD
jgi:hypothetical protein